MHVVKLVNGRLGRGSSDLKKNLWMHADRSLRTFLFDKKYKMSLPCMEDWVNQHSPVAHQWRHPVNRWTQKRGQAEAGVFKSRNGKCKITAFGRYTTIIQTEMTDIFPPLSLLHNLKPQESACMHCK